MGKKFLLLLFLFVSCSFYGQRVKFNKGKATQKKYTVQIPFKEIKGKLIIPVQIEGKEYQFLFDTGAPNLISHQLKSLIQTKDLKAINVNDANASSRAMKVVEIPLLEIAGVGFKNSPAIVNDDASNFLFECLEIHGIIGSNLMRNSIVQIDLDKKQFILTNQLSELQVNLDHSLEMALSQSQSSPYIWINLKGEGEDKEQVLIDTGAQGFYDLSLKSYDALNSNQVFANVQEAQGFKGIGLFGIAEPELHYRVLVPEISILSGLFKNVISVSTVARKSRIGADLLKYGVVTLDYNDRKFYFDPYESKFELNEKVWSFSPTMKDAALVIGLVWEKDLQKSMNYGDKIMKINDLDVSQKSICELLIDESPIKKENRIQLVVKDAVGSIDTLQLSKKFLAQKKPYKQTSN